MAEHERQGLLHPNRLRWFSIVNLGGAAVWYGAGLALPQFREVLHLGAAVNVVQALGAEALRLMRIPRKYYPETGKKKDYALAA